MSGAASSSSTASNAVSAANLLDAFGINTANSYDNSAQVIRALNYLGIHTVRESLKADGVAAQVQSAMADAGIKFNVLTPNSIAAVAGGADVQRYVDQIAAFATAHSGAVVAIEGQNEINIFGTSFAGDTSLQSAVTVQKLLYTDVKANATLANVSVLNLTVGHDDAATYNLIGDLSAYSDLANAHVYTGTGSNIDQRFSASLSAASAASSGNGVVVTEMGLTTVAGSITLSVDELAQAKMTIADMMLAYSQGATKAYIYSLFDTSDVTGTAPNDNFGLFHDDGTPKLAATAVHNLTTLLSSDEGTAMAGTFVVGGLGADAHSMNVTTESGATDLVLWRSISAWDRNAGAAATIVANDVTVTFSSVQAHVYVYSPVDGLKPIAVYENVSAITLPLSDTPLIVSLGTDEPFTDVSAVAPSATMIFDETNFVAQIDGLSHLDGLSTVQLTGDHVLKVSSFETMNDLLKNYTSVLGKIDGSYSFVVENTGAGWTTDVRYDQSGGLLSTTTLSFRSGGVTLTHIVSADGSVADLTSTNGLLQREVRAAADGSLSTITYDSAGHLATRTDRGPTGPSTYQTYDAVTGAVKSKEVMNADKSGDVYHYGITGQSYTSDHYVYGAGGAITSLTRFYANGTTAYSSVTAASGIRTVDIFDAAGHKTQEVITAANGAVTTTNFTYDSAGHLATRTDRGPTGPSTYQTYDAVTGAVKSKEVMNADKSGDVYHYGITGQSYTSDHYVYGAGGAITSLTRFYANGTTAYSSVTAASGIRTVDIFDAAGHKTQEVITAANGAVTTTNFTYDSAGHLATRTDRGPTGPSTYQTYDAVTGAVKSKEVMNADKSGDVYHYGITGQSYTSDHYVYGAGGAITSLTRFYANGTTAYSSVTAASGIRTVDIFDAAGHKTQEVITAANGAVTTTNFTYDSAGHLATRTDRGPTGPSTYQTYDAVTGAVKSKEVMNADKSGDVYHYGITGQSYTSDHYVYGAGGAITSLTRFYANGTTAYSSVTAASGIRTVDIFDAAGHKTQEVITAANGAVTTTNFTYDSAGHLATRTDRGPTGPSTYQTYDAVTGAVKSKEVMNADKSGDVYHYGITGQSYTSDHYVYGAGGAITSLTRFYANGTTAYSSVTAASGIRTVDIFDAAGHKTQEVITAANGAVTTTNFTYDSAGHLATRTDLGQTGPSTYQTYDAVTGAVKSKEVMNADKSGDVYHYGITGQSYTSDHYVYGAGGAITSLTRFYANGTTAYSSVTAASGIRTVDIFDAAGHKTQEVITAANGAVTTTNFTYDSAGHLATRTDLGQTGPSTYQAYDAVTGAVKSKEVMNADKSGDVYHYGITGQSYTSDHYVYGAGGAIISLTGYYANGTVAYSSVNNADSSRVVDNYDTAGVKIQEVVTSPENGRSTIIYDNAGHQLTRQDVSTSGATTYWVYDTISGAAKTMTVTNADKSGETNHYGITGQSYTSDRYAYGAGGATESLTRFHADGTLDYFAQYNSDGSRIVDNYDANGHKTLEVFIGTDGSKAYHGFTEVSDQQTLTANLYSFTSASGGPLSIIGATANLVDGNGHVIKALDTSDYTLSGGTFTLKAGALTGDLDAGDHAYIDISYAVSNGSTTAPNSMYSIQVDGTLHSVTGATVLEGGADADRFVVPSAQSVSIANFNFGEGDKIDLTKVDAIRTNTAGTLDGFTFQSSGTFSGKAGQLIAVQDSDYSDGKHWLVEGDTSGSGHADFVLHVTSLTDHMLVGSDFLLG